MFCMPRIRPERRKKQWGELLQLPGGKQGVMLSPQQFARLKTNPVDKPMRVIHKGERAVVFEDRREGKTGPPANGTGPSRGKNGLRSAVEEMLRQRELTKEQAQRTAEELRKWVDKMGKRKPGRGR